MSEARDLPDCPCVFLTTLTTTLLWPHTSIISQCIQSNNVNTANCGRHSVRRIGFLKKNQNKLLIYTCALEIPIEYLHPCPQSPRPSPPCCPSPTLRPPLRLFLAPSSSSGESRVSSPSRDLEMIRDID